MKMNKKGFTLAELLIVIAIIAILIAIAIPVFTTQLENARRQADHSNLRSAYAMVQTDNLVGGKQAGLTSGGCYLVDGTCGAASSTTNAVKIQATSHKKGEESCDTCVVNCVPFNKTAGGSDVYIYFVSTTPTVDDLHWALSADGSHEIAAKS